MRLTLLAFACWLICAFLLQGPKVETHLKTKKTRTSRIIECVKRQLRRCATQAGSCSGPQGESLAPWRLKLLGI